MTAEGLAEPLAVDTDAFSFVHLGTDRHAEFGALLAGHPLAMPFPVAGELTVLGIRSKWQARRRAALAAAIAVCVVIPSDAGSLTNGPSCERGS